MVILNSKFFYGSSNFIYSVEFLSCTTVKSSIKAIFIFTNYLKKYFFCPNTLRLYVPSTPQFGLAKRKNILTEVRFQRLYNLSGNLSRDILY